MVPRKSARSSENLNLSILDGLVQYFPMPFGAREEIKVFSQEGGSVALVRKLVAIVGHRCSASQEAGG